jgi:hypothetical protein
VQFSGIHYDALGLSPSIEAAREFDTTVFSCADSKLMEYAVSLAGLLHGVRNETHIIYVLIVNVPTAYSLFLTFVFVMNIAT